MLDIIEHPYSSVELTQVAPMMAQLHEQVCNHHRRVEITRPGSNDVCVMVSKQELESLEHAVDMFADTPAFEQMCQNLQQLLQTAGMVYGGMTGAE